MTQLDLICTQCPLASCDEESLFCVFRWMTNPNKEQREMLGIAVETKRERKSRVNYEYAVENDRSAYYASYYVNVKKPRQEAAKNAESK